MKRHYISILFILSSIIMSAQQDSVLLFPDGAPGLKASHLEEVVTYNKIQRVGQVISPTLYTYLPENMTEATPAVVICPGGGYHIVSIESEGHNLARWFQERGVAAFVLKYRIPLEASFDNKESVALQDVQQSFKYLHNNAKLFNIDKKKIGVMGFSAGGHLAASASVHYDKPLVDEKAKYLRPAFSLLIYPVITFDGEFTHKGSRKNLIGPTWTKEKEVYYSCEKQVTKSTPPTYLIHAKDDKAVPYHNSELYKEALDAHGVDNKLVLLETGGHGFGLVPGKATNYWVDSLADWMREMSFMPASN